MREGGEDADRCGHGWERRRNAAGERFIRGDGASGRGGGGGTEGLRRRSREDEETGADLPAADWSSWMALLRFVVQLFLSSSSLWAEGAGLVPWSAD